MRVVIDSNVLISGLFWAGQPRKVVDLATAGAFQALTSPALLAELEDVLSEDFIVPESRILLILRDILSYAEIISPDEDPPTAVRDAGDVKVIACAIAGNADYIVTGDKDLLVLGQVQGIPILTVKGFLEMLTREKP